MIFTEEKSLVEAALFAASDQLNVTEISELTGITEAQVRRNLKSLKKEYESRDSAILISQVGGKYRMQLRTEYQKFSGIMARPEFQPGVTRTLSAIAYNQPILQSKIVEVRGPRAYADVNELVDQGYVHSKPKGQTYELTTTKKFSEDFGIGSTNPDQIRKWIDKNSSGMHTKKGSKEKEPAEE